MKTDSDDFIYHHELSDDFIEELYTMASEEIKGLKLEELKEDQDHLEMQIKSELAKIWWDNNVYYETRLLQDNQYAAAKASLKQARNLLIAY